MTTLFSPATGYFYDDQINSFIPLDSREISDDLHRALLAGQSDGRRIVSDENGFPALIDPPPVAPEVLAGIERKWRDDVLAATDGLISRHRDELEEGVPTTLTADQYAELQAYRRALRGWPQGGGFPLIEHRPTAPTWLAEQIL